MDRPRRIDPDPSLPLEYRGRLGGDRWQPAVDVFETEKAVLVRVELAGVTSSDVKVTVDGEWLIVRGQRAPADDEVQRLHQMEIAFGRFERRLHVPVPFERDRVAASLDDGFLTVVLPKRQPGRHRIPVRSET